MAIYLTIDLGTTGCRSILIDENLNPLAEAYKEYELITPQEKWTEQDAELWWRLMVYTTRSAISKAGISGTEIENISISSQGITIVPVDEDLKPLCNAMSWLDIRAEEECRQIKEDFGQEYIYGLTGKPIDAAYSLPKILWLRNHRPDIYEQTWKFLMPLDFLTAKLTGTCVTDHSMASGTLLYDLKKNCWSKELLDHYKIKECQLPELCWSGEVAGKVLPEAAEELGISTECLVTVGAQDQKCAAYGMGLDDRVMTISLGTAAAITKRWSEAKVENKGVGWCGYVEPGTWVTEGVINTAGTCLRWVRDTLFPGEDYDVINREAADALTRGSSLMFYPYMNGPSSPDYYAESEGTFYGVNLATKRGDFALAVMEGVAFQIRIILEAMDAYGKVDTLILFGGGAKSPLWQQIIADVVGMEVKMPRTTEAACAGAARLAAKAMGRDIKTLGFAHTYVPSKYAKAYREKYKKYRMIEKRLWT